MANHTVYAVASGKGGVGKTVTSVNLGAALAARGNAVVVVDVDLGMANLGGFLGVGDDGPTLHEVLAGETALETAVYEVGDRLAAVPSGVSLDGFASVDTDELSAAVDALSSAFDYVILDLGAGLSHDTVLPLALADAVMLVSTDDAVSLGDTNKTRQITERLGTPVGGLLLTRTGPPESVDVDAASDAVGVPVLAVVPEDDAVGRAAEQSRPVVTFDPDSPAARAYEGLADIVVEESLADAPVLPSVPAERTPAATTPEAADDDDADPDDPTPAPTGAEETGSPDDGATEAEAAAPPDDGAAEAGETAPPDAATTEAEETASPDEATTGAEEAASPDGAAAAEPAVDDDPTAAGADPAAEGATAGEPTGAADTPDEAAAASGRGTADATDATDPTDATDVADAAGAEDASAAPGASLAADVTDDGDAGAAETATGEAPAQPGAGPRRAEEGAESTAEEIAAAIEAAGGDDGEEEAPALSVEGTESDDDEESGGLLSRFFG